jgi:hypothetical protein
VLLFEYTNQSTASRKDRIMKTGAMKLTLWVIMAMFLGGCMAQMSQEDQARLDAALKAADSAAASAQSAETSAKSAASSEKSSASSAERAEAAADRAESAAKRSEAAAASAQSSADKAAKAFEMGLRK